MDQNKIKLDIIKQFTNSLEVVNNKLVTTLDEDDYYEFKKSLHSSQHGISKDYLKTIAGLANNKGGLIIFGIDPNSKELKGINEKHENLDNKNINMVISEFLDGMNFFFFFTNRFEGKLIGFLLVNEPNNKPVIVKSNFNHEGENYVAGDIYYRYPGEVMKIKPSDLRGLITKEINRHTQQFLKQINTLVDIGPQNAEILNSQTGVIESSGGKLMLSPEILSDLNLILEGHFVEKDGAPAYVIKGNIELESGEPVSRIIKEKVHATLHNRDYHFSLLDNECSNPMNFIKEIVYRDTYYLPIFNLLNKANITKTEAINIIHKQNSPDVKKTTKTKIIERLSTPDSCLNLKNQGTIKPEITEIVFEGKPTFDALKIKHDFKGNFNKTVIRTILYNQLKASIKIEPSVKKEYIKEYIEAFSHLSKEELTKNQDYYFTEFKSVLTDHQEKLSNDSPTKTAFRKTICLMDYLIFG